jgi:hypothetical protein
MEDERSLSKSELKRIFTNLTRRKITDVMMSVLIDLCYNEKTNIRSSGFNYPGGTDSVMSWNDGTRTFTITPFDPEVDEWKARYAIWSWAGSAVLHRRTKTETIELPNEEGLFCIYFDKGVDIRYQVLKYIKNPTEAELKELYTEKVIVTFIYWDAAAGEALHFGDDRHGSEWTPQIHWYLHNAFRARRKTGLQFESYIADGDGSLNDHAKFSITSGVMLHDDFELAITGAGPGLPILYAFGGVPRFVANSGYAIYKGASRLCFNSGLNTINQCADENFVLYHIFATNEILTTSRKIVSVMGTHEYTTAGDAFKGLDAELDEIAVYMPQQGRCYLGSVLFQTSDAYGNDINGRVIVLMNGDTHPPVSIAPGSEAYLFINELQQLGINVDALPGGEAYAYDWNIHSPEQIIGDLDEPANVIATIDGTGAVDETIPAGTYAIVALNEAGETLPVNVPEMVILVDTTSVVVTCDAVTGATGYRVYEVAIGLYYELLTPSWDYLTQTPATAGTLPVSNTAYIYQNPFTIDNGDTVEFTGEGIDVETSVDTTRKTVLLKKQRSNWNATEGPNVIDNKPTIPAGQIQSDWNQATNTEPDYIKNKPTIPPLVINTDEKVKYDAADPAAGYLSTKIISGDGIELSEGTGEDENKLKVSVIADVNVRVCFDFITTAELYFIYTCPQAMVFTSQQSEHLAAAIDPPLNTELAQYDKVTITAAETGLIILDGHTL